MEDFKHYEPLSEKEDPIHHGRRYDVFINHRGHDARNAFANMLFQSLQYAGLNVFLDSETIKKGEDIGMSLEEAIKNSRVHIPILTPGYARSAWCLRELSLMLRCKARCAGTHIIPLFYNVKPEHVRYPDDEKSPDAEPFERHSQNETQRKEEIEKWKKALDEVALLPGWSLETASGCEARLTKKVVTDLLQRLNIKSLHVAENPVGLTTPAEDLFKLLKMDCDHRSRTVGIYGMGGLGKTTLSKVIYNKTHRMFGASCFVSDVRTNAKKSVNGLINLQRQIIKELIGADIELNSVDQGKSQMKNHLLSVRALVIFDDVENRKQFDALVGDWYGAGSRIIITTRDEKILNPREVDDKYPMKLLDRHEGEELFCWHAFLASSPHKGYEDMTRKIVKACAGLPLSLKTMGAHLHNERDLKIWSESLTKLTNIEFTALYECLKSSYDGLSDQEKRMFLDIATNIGRSPSNQNKEFYVEYWKRLGFKAVNTSLKKIERKSLIVIDESYPNSSHFRIHNHMRDLGRRIVREESLFNWIQQSAHRLWQSSIVALMKGLGIPSDKVWCLII